MTRIIQLFNIDTSPPQNLTKEIVKPQVKELAKKIGKLQYKLYSEDRRSLLVVLQGMDASGKDGVTRKVFRYCNPSGLKVAPFKKPTDLEFSHDFLWRVHQKVPAKGETVIFNRSHYEDILIQRVHKWINEDTVKNRMEAINDFEKLIERNNNTIVLKFFLHLSEERQKEKLQERIDVPEKNWKHNDGDWEERKHWDAYMQCYQDVMNMCNHVPWHVIPSDKRWYRDYMVAKKVLETLITMDPQLPELKSEM